MSDLKTVLPKLERAVLEGSRRHAPEDPRQRKLMVGSLCLLLMALSIVLWRDRDFWFSDTPDEDSVADSIESSPVTDAGPAQPATMPVKSGKTAKSKHQLAKNQTAKPHVTIEVNASDSSNAPPAVATTSERTVLPPLEVEVISGTTHRTIRPGSSSVHVDLQPGAPTQPVVEAKTSGDGNDTQTAANITTAAAERMQMSSDTSEIVTYPVKPNYPLLAKQMKVQGSVILQAMIGKDGIIQNLRVLSGPHILAGAAQDAVRQWHFKPHFQGSDAVETQAKITVNFTISTN
jgi:TonB family protein